MKKTKQVVYYNPNKIKGFTLIEFLVASMLAMIVIVAASGTYMITRKLNQSTQERISVQQDIRNASVQIARDARMAGSFGCFNTGDNQVADKTLSEIRAKNANVRNAVFLKNDEKDGYGVRVIPATNLAALSLSGLSNPSDALLFIYGQSTASVQVEGLTTADSNTISKLNNFNIQDESDPLLAALNGKGDVVLSTCRAITKLNVNSVTSASGKLTVNVANETFKVSSREAGELTLSKLHASLYVLGDINRGTQNKWDNEKALLRYDLGADGSWQNPQLLATGINNANNQGMTFAFGYVNPSSDTCKNEATSATNSETFSFFDSPANNTAGNRLPALVQIRLKYYANKATGTQADALTRDYIINTTVRGGNTCANRLTS